MIRTVAKIAREAGDIILKYYNSIGLNINIKSDGSPVTKADIKSEQYILSQLNKNFNYPIVTEETPVKYSERKKWKKYWLVDPLDGTEDFIKKTMSLLLILP